MNMRIATAWFTTGDSEEAISGARALRSDSPEQALMERERFFTLSLDMMGIIDFEGYFRQLN